VTTTLEELGATLTLDIERFVREAMRSAQAAEDIADAAKAAGDATGNIESGAQGAARAAGQLGDDLKDLEGRLDDTAKAADDIGDTASGIKRVGDAASESAAGVGDLADAADDIGEVGDAAEESASRMGKVGEAASGAAETIAGAFTGGAAVEAASKLAERISGAFEEALDVEAGVDKMQAQLGMSAYGAENYGRMAGDLYSQAYGDSLEQVNEALVLMNRNVGDMVGEQDNAFEGATASVLDLASAMDQDLGPITKAVGQMIRTGLAVDAKQALDILTRGFQEGADASEDLLDTFNEYSTKFRDIGLDGEHAMGLLVQGMHAGARDSDLVADALKEFAIRSKDASDTSAAGFQLIGLNAEKMTAQFARGGPEAAEGLDVVLDRLRGMTDPVKQNAAAVDLFGSQAEDLGQALFALDPSSAVQGLGQVTGAAAEMGTTLADNAAGRIEVFKRAMQTGLVDFVGSKVLPAFESIADTVKPVFDGARGAVSLFMSALGGRDESGAAAAILPPELIGTITSVAGGLRELGQTVLPTLLDWWNRVWDAAEKVTGWARQNEDVMNGLKVYLGVQLVVALGAAAVGFGALAVAAWGAAAGVIAATWPAIAIAAALVALAAGISWAYRNWGWFKTAVDAAGAGLAWLWNNVLVPVGGFISGTLVPILGTVIGVLANFIGNLAGWAGNIPQALGAVVEFFEGLPGKALEFLGMLWTTVSTWVVTTASALPGILLGWVTSFWSWITTVAAELPGQLAYLAGFVIGWIIGMQVVFVQNLLGWVTSFWSWITTTVAELPGRLISIAGSLWAWIAQTAAELPGQLAAWWEQFKAWAYGLMISIGQWGIDTKNALSAWIAQTGSELPGRLRAWWDAFRAWAADLVSSIGAWGGDVINRMRDWIGSLPDQVRGAIGGMLSVGRSIVEGIWNGISGAGGWLADRIRNFASGIVSGFMSAIKGGSPAMKFTPVGQSMVQGVDLGMVREAPRLIETASTVAGQVQDGMQAAMTELAGAAWGGELLFEDMTYPGASANLLKYNDQIADMFWAQNKGADWGTGTWEQGTLGAFLANQRAKPAASGGPVVTFTGNTGDALATVIMQMIRTGQIQISAAA
jgi:phage-related minor tail protein